MSNSLVLGGHSKPRDLTSGRTCSQNWIQVEDREYSITPVIRNNWDREPSEYVENLDNWIFL
jgi:hypothetical protein